MMRLASSVTLVSILIGSLIFSLSLVSCAGNDETPEPEVVSPIDPPLVDITSSIETPAGAFNSPVVAPPRGPDFAIDEQVKAGDTIVRGTGPAGVTINIVDVSWGGEVKGSGVISEDGTFAIEVTPIEGGNDIGIMIADLAGTDYEAEDFQNNENYRDIPMVGFLADMYRVPKN